MQRSGNRGAGELWIKSGGKNKTIFKDDELISEEVDAYRYHEQLFIETNDVEDPDLAIYKKPLPAAANLKKFMQYCVDIVPCVYFCNFLKRRLITPVTAPKSRGNPRYW